MCNIDIAALKKRVMPLDNWVYRGDPESYETCVIRENAPDFPTKEVNDILNSFGWKGYFNRLVLSCVPAGKSILPHRDDFGEKVRSKSIHCHLPIFTHPSAVMGIGGGETHLEEGTVYQMDETQEHFVKNPSSIDRIHLLFAFFKEK